MSEQNPDISVERRVPEILAPVGGREQFFAALNSGADAVFLGLKNFNARARAENFTCNDLRELVPLAHRHAMKVLVTMNILIKNCELTDLVNTLAELEDIGVDAIIVQDVGLARLCRQFFPNLRLHASTQLAVHNTDGVRAAMAMGFKRVVLARELTALEIKKIRAAIPLEDVELEAFCHGSLCYSYSGLCFFSGAEDARSGNRGECAYTCRKPYKILNEPGHGFLFSMKDLNTVENLGLLLDAGVDTLKIEGRKKDAQYVTGVVEAYRNQLNKLFGRQTLRPEAPAIAHAMSSEGSNKDEALREQLSLTFHRNDTSFFLKGRYHENVIDLDNPTHKGQFVGTVEKVVGRKVTVTSECALERFDGLRIDPSNKLYHSTPQHGLQSNSQLTDVKSRYDNKVCHFSLRTMWQDGRLTPTSEARRTVEIEIPDDLQMPSAGDLIYRTRSDALRRKVEKLSAPQGQERLKPNTNVEFKVDFETNGELLKIGVSAVKLEKVIFKTSAEFAAIRPQAGSSSLCHDLGDLLKTLGNINFAADKIDFMGDSEWFVPRSRLKELKRTLESHLPTAHAKFLSERLSVAVEHIASFSSSGQRAPARLGSTLSLKIDRCEYLPWIEELLGGSSPSLGSEKITVDELVFEPKRAFLNELSPAKLAETLKTFAQLNEISIRLAFPTVLRAWDEPLMKRWTEEFFAAGLTAVEIGNVGHFSMLERWNLKEKVTSFSSDFTLYSLNQAAAAEWAERGVERITLSVEDDFKNISSLLSGFPSSASAQVILYKDTPLFIAESCSLTALHNGCPTNKVCGYRTLEIQNDEGEIFYVAHESCKSIVYAKKPFALSQKLNLLRNTGAQHFRADFLTRLYDKESLQKIVKALLTDEAIGETHSANFNRTLL
ncbi:MAG: hypothetical protein RLZZ488_2440 [Pseudomonadota bacterium]